MAMWAHLGGIVGFIPSLVIYLIYKDRGPFTRQEAKEALNWQITITIFMVAFAIVMSIITSIVIGVMYAGSLGAIRAGFGFASLMTTLTWVPWIANIVFSIMGAMKAKDGNPYRYPVALRLVK